MHMHTSTPTKAPSSWNLAKHGCWRTIQTTFCRLQTTMDRCSLRWRCTIDTASHSHNRVAKKNIEHTLNYNEHTNWPCKLAQNLGSNGLFGTVPLTIDDEKIVRPNWVPILNYRFAMPEMEEKNQQNNPNRFGRQKIDAWLEQNYARRMRRVSEMGRDEPATKTWSPPETTIPSAAHATCAFANNHVTKNGGQLS